MNSGLPKMVREMVRQYGLFFRFHATHTANGQVVEHPGITIAFAGTGVQMFNAAVLTEPAATTSDLIARLDLARDFFDGRSAGWALIVCDELLSADVSAEAPDLLAERDLYPLFSWQGMRLGPLSQGPPPAAELEIRRVESAEDRHAFARINAQAYKSAEGPYVELIAPASVWSGELTGYLGLLDGEPVSTVGALLAEGVIQICWVATLASRRRKGFADALLRHALADQWKGPGKDQGKNDPGAPSVLFATPDGFPGYQRIGYRTEAKFTGYWSG